MKTEVGIVGAAGFAGAELMRLLVDHEEFEMVCVTSDSSVGLPVSDMYPALRGRIDLHFSPHDDQRLFDCSAVFLAVPHTAALRYAAAFLEKGISVFDLSADFRLKDIAAYEAYYGAKHTSPTLLKEAFFGLPELFPTDMENAAHQYKEGKPVLVSCAGCYPTASSLAAFPAVHSGLTQGPVIIDAISGITGAGKTATDRTHFCSGNENVEAYAVTTHRHTPEIEQILDLPGQIIFTPHLAPFNRGLLSTVYLPLVNEMSVLELHKLYNDFYANKTFVQLLPLGKMPKTSSVAGSNNAQIGLALEENTNTLIVVAAIDNLCKGAAGQAVQCANRVFGWAENSGLRNGSLPV